MTIRKYIKQTKLTLTTNYISDTPVALKLLYSFPKGTRGYYDILVQDKTLPSCCAKWSEKMTASIPWDTVFMKI